MQLADCILQKYFSIGYIHRSLTRNQTWHNYSQRRYLNSADSAPFGSVRHCYNDSRNYHLKSRGSFHNFRVTVGRYFEKVSNSIFQFPESLARGPNFDILDSDLLRKDNVVMSLPRTPDHIPEKSAHREHLLGH